jgi:molybdenum cofactor cytidylyltransferase
MISAILLGAGESKRMGMNKLSLLWKKKTIFEHCLKTLLGSNVDEVIVVLNKKIQSPIHLFEDRKVKVVINPHFHRGMSTSICKGVQALDPKSKGILIALGDQPFLKTRTIDALVRAFQEGKGAIIVPSFRGKRGHPVIFHRKYEEELSRLKGDVGGRSILEKHTQELKILPVQSKGVVKDIDTWQDYRRGSRKKKGGLK